ncbi:unnamed protein product [Brassica rapa subsp. narinosa]
MGNKLLLQLLLLLPLLHAYSGISTVRYLPGYHGPLPFELETGGDHDLLVPFLATQDWMRSLNYSIVEDWRPWMVHNQVAGYNSISFGGGHTIVYKPDEYSAMFKRWINGQPL